MTTLNLIFLQQELRAEELCRGDIILDVLSGTTELDRPTIVGRVRRNKKSISFTVPGRSPGRDKVRLMKSSRVRIERLTEFSI